MDSSRDLAMASNNPSKDDRDRPRTGKKEVLGQGKKQGQEQGQWRCISGCGACCRLDPSLREEAIDALSPSQQEQYLSMVGADGWCIHFNTGSRSCRIYADRPDFCNVANLVKLFGSPQDPGAGDRLAIGCCLQQIRSEYGGRGKVIRRFRRAIRERP